MERDSKERSVINDSKRNSIHSDWSNLIPIDVEVEYQRIYNIRKRPDTRLHTSTVTLAAPVAKGVSVPPSSPVNTHKTVKNIVLEPYTPKPNEWGSWQEKKSQLAISTAASPNSVCNEEQGQQQEEEIVEVYQP